jgi:glycosyltransferase involved in cell wall biosynthesis
METPGLAALEAAACGAKLALTREGCTEEYFGDYAVYLNPDDPGSIRQATEQALSREKRPELPEYIRQRYTWKKAAEQLLAVYRDVLPLTGMLGDH